MNIFKLGSIRRHLISLALLSLLLFSVIFGSMVVYGIVIEPEKGEVFALGQVIRTAGASGQGTCTNFYVLQNPKTYPLLYWVVIVLLTGGIEHRGSIMLMDLTQILISQRMERSFQESGQLYRSPTAR